MSDRAIWKYRIGPGTQVLYLPDGYRLLHVHEQDGVVCMWADVKPDADKVECWIDVRATGQPFADIEDVYLGTIHIDGLVFHAYEVMPA